MSGGESKEEARAGAAGGLGEQTGAQPRRSGTRDRTPTEAALLSIAQRGSSGDRRSRRRDNKALADALRDVLASQTVTSGQGGVAAGSAAPGAAASAAGGVGSGSGSGGGSSGSASGSGAVGTGPGAAPSLAAVVASLPGGRRRPGDRRTSVPRRDGGSSGSDSTGDDSDYGPPSGSGPSSDGSLSEGSDRSNSHRRHGAHSRREHAARERWGREAFRAIRRTATRSFVSENSHHQYRKRRNAEEALAWCAALDGLLATRGITGDHAAVEVAVRRLVVVREADRTDSWAVAKALTVWTPGIDIGTMEQHRRLRRDVAAIRAEGKDSARDRTTGDGGRSRRPRRGGGSARSTKPAQQPSGGSSSSRGGGSAGARRPPRAAQ
jgi:hypothetical protein